MSKATVNISKAVFHFIPFFNQILIQILWIIFSANNIAENTKTRITFLTGNKKTNHPLLLQMPTNCRNTWTNGTKIKLCDRTYIVSLLFDQTSYIQLKDVKIVKSACPSIAKPHQKRQFKKFKQLKWRMLEFRLILLFKTEWNLIWWI